MIGMKKAVIAILFGILSMVAGCNTVQGVGEDVEKGGEAIQDAAS